MRKRKAGLEDYVLPTLAFIVIIAAWELVDYVLDVKEIVVPNPHEILFAVINNFSRLIYDTGITMMESIFGFIIGSVMALLIAASFVSYKTTKKAFYPYAIALKATPLYALAPLLTLWFGNGMLSKIVMSAMVAFFPVLVSAVKGFTAVEQEAIDLFKSLSSSRLQFFLKLRIPNALPYIFPALKIATTLAVVGATIAEFTGASRGIGHLIVNSSYYLETSLMFAGIIMISLGGILFFYLVDFIEKKAVFWQVSD